MPSNLKQHSHIITDGRDRAGARAMLKAIGFTDEDLAKPIVGIANTWIETMPCNYHLRALAEKVKAGVRAAGGTPMELNTIAISDGVTMGTEGMKASLVSREVVADSIELVGRGHMFDGIVALVGCDKTIPGGAMALIRLNVPSVLLYGGSIAAGRFQGRDVSVGDVFEAVGANAAGLMTDAELKQLENHACPGAGACGGQFTANTMSTVMEFIGLSPMGLNSIPALDPKKEEAAFECGRIVMDLLKRGVKPLDILTRRAFENAIASVAATGGSTDAVLHLLAMAREANVPLAIDDFNVVSSRTPIIADLKPGGRYMAVDVHRAGGIPLIAKKLLEAGLIDGTQMTPTGRTIAEEAARVTETPGQDVVRPVSDPLKKTGGLVILKGNLAPEGCVIKVAGYERTRHRVVAGISGNLLANPVRPFKGLVFPLQLDFRHDQPLVYSRKFVDFPDEPLIGESVPLLFNLRLRTEGVQHFPGINQRNLVFVLTAGNAHGCSLDGQETFFSGYADPHRALLAGAEIALAVFDPFGQPAPALAGDRKLDVHFLGMVCSFLLCLN